MPARPRKARDKAKVEVGVQVAQRWIVARLRHEVFFSLPALNARIAETETSAASHSPDQPQMIRPNSSNTRSSNRFKRRSSQAPPVCS